MSKKSLVLLAGLGLAATAAGAWVVRHRSIGADVIEPIAAPAPGVDAPDATTWTGDDEDALAGELAAATDDEPVNIR
jgi:hypothetical protein